jgi:hypothetical protein
MVALDSRSDCQLFIGGRSVGLGRSNRFTSLLEDVEKQALKHYDLMFYWKRSGIEGNAPVIRVELVLLVVASHCQRCARRLLMPLATLVKTIDGVLGRKG